MAQFEAGIQRVVVEHSANFIAFKLGMRVTGVCHAQFELIKAAERLCANDLTVKTVGLHTDGHQLSLVLPMLFWSLFTTYKGALALFPVSRGRARLWFVVLPAVFYFFVVGGVALLYAAFG